MKKYYIIFAGVCVVILAWVAYKPFDDIINIDDTSKIQEFEIGNNSYFMSPTNIRGTIKGQIDGDALVIISSERMLLKYIKNNKSKLKSNAIYLEKGIINKTIWSDYYKDYYTSGPGYIYYVPLSAKKGNVKIDWSI